MPSRVRLTAWNPASKFEQEGDEVTEQTFVAFSPWLSPSRSPSLSLPTYYFSPPPSISECVWRDLRFAIEEQEEVQNFS